MTEPKSIDYHTFMSLNGLRLVEYVEPLLIDPAIDVPAEMLAKLLSQLSELDEFHLVYALQLGATFSLESFLPRFSTFLNHKHDSVRCTALNILDRIPDKHVSRELVEAVRQALESNTIAGFGCDAFRRLELRLRHRSR